MGTFLLINWIAFLAVMGYGVYLFASLVKNRYEAIKRGKKAEWTQTNKERLDAVLVNVYAEDVWLVGFLTDEDLSGFKLGASYVAVYTPQAYNVAGQLFLVKRERVRPIEHLSSADVMKYAVTGGAVELIGAPTAPSKSGPKLPT